ncbi:MAG: peptide deformylase [Pyrinomonadaceae bacterium MAG19_C2-C3]|nr:peptide deformylase [Pyrinomonadaceae bacterium MAG19_C2-C3]
MRMLKSEFMSRVKCHLRSLKAEVIQPDESVKLAAQTTIERQNKMAILKIVKYPEAVLERAGDAVTEFDDDLKQLVSDMFETMYNAPGVGLAAPQVGVSKQVFVMDCSGGKDPQQKIAMINPKVLHTEGEYTAEEGCLSFPGIFFDVKRPMRAVVRAQDVNGKEFEVDGLELTARCMLHEKDHLDGVLFLQRTSPLKREMAKRRIRKLIKQGEW